MIANNKGSGETVRMRWLTGAFAGRLCDKYQNLMSWLKYLYFGHKNSGFPELSFRIYAILVFIKVFWFGTKVFYTINLLWVSDRDYFWNRGSSEWKIRLKF